MARNLRALLPLVAEYGTDRIAFCTDDRDPEDIADDGHVNGMVREAVAAGNRARGRARAHGLASTPRSGTGSHVTARSRPATRRICSSSPTSRASGRERRAEAGPTGRGDPARGGPRLGAAVGPDRTARRRRISRSRGRAARTGDRPRRGPGRHRIARARAGRRGRARGRRRRARPGEDRSRRAPSRHRAGSGSASCAGSGLRAARSRRASRTTRTTSSSSACPTETWRSRSSASPSSEAGSSRSRTGASSRSARCRWPGCSRTRRSRR